MVGKTEAPEEALFNNPHGVGGVDKEGTVYIADWGGNNRLRKLAIE